MKKTLYKSIVLLCVMALALCEAVTCFANQSHSATLRPKTVTVSNVKYAKKTVKPTVKAVNTNNAVIASTYYTVAYYTKADCKTKATVKKVGKYYAKITFKGRYSGSIVKAFKVVPKLSFTSKQIRKGGSVTLSVSSSAKVTYASSDKRIATVSSKGVIKGVKAGTATITVTSGKIRVKCTVTVKTPVYKINSKTLPKTLNNTLGNAFALGTYNCKNYSSFKDMMITLFTCEPYFQNNIYTFKRTERYGREEPDPLRRLTNDYYYVTEKKSFDAYLKNVFNCTQKYIDKWTASEKFRTYGYAYKGQYYTMALGIGGIDYDYTIDKVYYKNGYLHIFCDSWDYDYPTHWGEYAKLKYKTYNGKHYWSLYEYYCSFDGKLPKFTPTSSKLYKFSDLVK